MLWCRRASILGAVMLLEGEEVELFIANEFSDLQLAR